MDISVDHNLGQQTESFAPPCVHVCMNIRAAMDVEMASSDYPKPNS